MTERIHLIQSSMQRTDNRLAIVDDLAEAFDQGADFIAFSEASRFPVDHLLKREAQMTGYNLFLPKRGDCAIAAHPKHRVLDVGYIHILDGRSGQLKGNYSARGLVFMTVETPDGNIITDHTTHWNTGYRLDGKPGHESLRELNIDKQTDAVAEYVKMHGSGRRIAFWQGDTNVDERKDRGYDHGAIHHQFNKAGLRSVFDELGQYPDTHGRRTIDIIGSYDPDRRVKAVRAKVHPRRNADHRMVSAWYDIHDKAGAR